MPQDLREWFIFQRQTLTSQWLVAARIEMYLSLYLIYICRFIETAHTACMLIQSRGQCCELTLPQCKKEVKHDANRRRVLLCLGVFSFIELGSLLYHQFCTFNIALARNGRLHRTKGRYSSDCGRLRSSRIVLELRGLDYS